MRREGCDEENLKPEDFICDFCRQTWADDRQMVEGHRGSLICQQCLTQAYDLVFIKNGGTPVPEMVVCTLCQAHHDTPHWQGPGPGAPVVCKRCINQSAVILEKDQESGWRRPGAAKP
jgi:hypothetical protein